MYTLRHGPTNQYFCRVALSFWDSGIDNKGENYFHSTALCIKTKIPDDATLFEFWGDAYDTIHNQTEFNSFAPGLPDSDNWDILEVEVATKKTVKIIRIVRPPE